MKKYSSALFALAASALLLVSCSVGNSASSLDSIAPSNSETSKEPTPDSSKETSSEDSESLVSSEEESKSETVTEPSEEPQEFTISLVGDPSSVGVEVQAPSSAIEGSTVTLEVTVSEGHILEYIRLYAPTSAGGGVRVSPDEKGAYTFVMPSQNLTIYYKGVVGYTVSFASDHASAVLAEDSAPYDLFGEGYPVYVMKNTVEEGYSFTGFTVEDENGNSIETWNDRIDQVGFLMPAGNVTVTAHAVAVDAVFVELAETYSNGWAIDMNEPASGFELQIDIDGRITLKTDWADPYWTGIATYSGGVLSADLCHLTGDGYYTDAFRHFDATFHQDRDYVTAKLSSGETVYNYLFARTSEAMVVKKIFASDALDGGYVLKHRIALVSAASGDFFCYTTPDRKASYSFLRAFEASSGEEVHNLFKGGNYVLKDASGNEVVAVSYDGSKISVSGLERGTYAVDESTSISLDGFGNYSKGEETGTYVLKGDQLKLSSGEEYTIDREAKTATRVEKTAAHPFSGKTYATSETNPIKIFEESYDDYAPNDFQFLIQFGLGEGEIEQVSFLRLGDPWPQVGSTKTLTTNISYTYSETTGRLTARLGNDTATMVYDAESDSFRYSGTIWYSNQGDYQTNNKDLTLTLKA
ncbi:MAG: hypothetical protein SOV58_04160 [Candidatus Enteromonas sp.]|nr:hypothetical protein [Candidatus Enteromonas sp.]